MAAKIRITGTYKTQVWAFHCPGCGYDHAFTVGPQNSADVAATSARWTFNGSLEAPTFSPSLLCNKDTPSLRCHSFVEDGKIRFLTDCFHKLAGKTVELTDYED